MFAFLGRNSETGAQVGIAPLGAQTAFAVVRGNVRGRAVLEHCELLERAAPQASALDARLRTPALARAPVSSVLDTEEYRLLTIEAPDVPPAEMRAAVRWRLRETIDFPMEDAVVDVFDLPPETRRTQGRMMYAVATRRAVVDAHAAALADWPGFDAIDIPELCLRNLATLLPGAAGGVTLLHVAPRAILLVIVRGATLYLARRMERPAGSDEAAGVALELQRSLDYYERTYDQPPITEAVVSAPAEQSAGLAAALAHETGLRVVPLVLGDYLECPQEIPAAVQAECTLAVAAALRQRARTL